MDAWESWFNEFGPALQLYARQLTSSTADAEDAVQEAFASCVSRRPSPEDARAFLFACVRNAVRQQRRSDGRRTARELVVATDEDWFECPADGIQRDERNKEVEAAIAALPKEQREIVVLRIWGELSFAETANMLSISPNTAASRFRYALERLRRVLHPEHEPTSPSP